MAGIIKKVKLPTGNTADIAAKYVLLDDDGNTASIVDYYYNKSDVDTKFTSTNTNVSNIVSGATTVGNATNASNYSAGGTIESALNDKASTATTDDLQTQITNLKTIGRFLALWNAATGKPTSYPTVPEGAEYPYTYNFNSGDYYRVTTAGSWIPSGDSITKQSAESEWTITAAEGIATAGDIFYYDNNSWVRQISASGKVDDVQINSTTIVSGGVASISLDDTLKYTSSQLGVNISSLQTDTFTPTGNVAVTLSDAKTVSNITDAGTLPTFTTINYTAPTFTQNVSNAAIEGIKVSLNDGVLTFDYANLSPFVNNTSSFASGSLTGGEYTQGTLPTYESITIMNNASASFIGDQHDALGIKTKE